MTTSDADTALTPADRDEIIQQARDFMRLRGVSQAALARMIGHGSSTLGEALSGAYKGDIDEILRKIPQAINEYYRSESAPGKGQFVRSRLAERIFVALKYASRFRKMVAVYGPSGVGKSFGVQAILAAEFGSAIYIEVNDTCRSPRHLYLAMIKALRLRVYNGHPRNAELAQAIYGRLANSGRLIVIDEADGLQPSALNCLRQLHDATGCPVALVGRPNLIARIDRTTDRSEIGGSIVRRLVGRFHLDESAETGGDGGSDEWICTVAEMAAMLKRFKVTFGAESVRWLCKLAHVTAICGVDQREAGGLALALDIAEMASVCYANRAITVPMLEAAMGQIRGRAWSASIVSQVQIDLAQETRRRTAAG